MPVLSRTGLVPTVGKKIKLEIQPRTTLDVSNIAVPAPYVLRPFAGIYNPFPYGCSVLCNHPADLEAKNVVKKAKDSWAIEGRGLLTSDDLKAIKCQKFHRTHDRGGNFLSFGDTVPEELFRRYTDTDSRPVTPAPTIVSLSTKHSQYLRRRRCMTPDPVPSFPNRERTLLVLDLRRSHSQETITWIGSQQGDNVAKTMTTTTTTATSRTSSISRATASSKKKKIPGKTEVSTPRSGKFDSPPKEEKSSRMKSFEGKSFLTPEPTPDNQNSQIPDISSSGNSSDPEVVKRRGKRKKRGKSGKQKDGDKEFKGFPEPGETQVSALGNESRMGSTRASLTAATALLNEDETDGDRIGTADEDTTRSPKKKSFLDANILKQLQRQLDNQVVESELNLKRKIALEEALRLKPKLKPSQQNQEIKSLRKELQLSGSHLERWLTIPRVFTRQSARFELPMDSRTLNDLTPLQYAVSYVFLSEERLILYNHVFNQHMEEMDEDDEENQERILLGKNVVAGLNDIMGRRMTTEEATDFQALIGWTDDMTIDFRMFTGIGALCERLLAHKFCPDMPDSSVDLKHEVERADFESLDRKLLYLEPNEKMIQILIGIRDS